MTPTKPRAESSMQNVLKSQNPNQKRAAPDSDEQDSNDNSVTRKRITRACDQCNQLRSKCDGMQPCGHCIENDLSCAYERAHKKRGRVPKKDQNLAGAAKSARQQDHLEISLEQNEQIRMNSSTISPNASGETVFHTNGRYNNDLFTASGLNVMQNNGEQLQSTTMNILSDAIDTSNKFGQLNTTNFDASDAAIFNTSNLDMSGFGFPLGDDFSVGFMGRAPMIESPDWLTFASPMVSSEQWASQPRPSDAIRFPVLQPILPYLESIIPSTLACDLLEQYFVTASLTGYQPRNPYVLGYIFRKQSILHPTNPRTCTAALLASMLWISAQNSDAAFLTNQPDARSRTCQKLLELTIDRLKPLVHNHGPSSGHSGHDGVVQKDAGIGGLVLATDVMAGKEISRQQVDNIVTYIHLAAVVSASERKAASLRWWNTAWSLARETKLGREIAHDQPLSEDNQPHPLTGNLHTGQSHQHSNSMMSDSARDGSRHLLPALSEEDREERRRTWWMLYLMDRHLALCYNRPAFFLNKECEGLLLPMDEDRFQSGQFDYEPAGGRRRGLDVECTSFSVYGFFLPLMVILGEILDLNHARNRPRLGPGAKRPRDFSGTVTEIEEQLQAFEQSVHKAWAHHQAEIRTRSTTSAESHDKKTLVLQAKMAVAYATHIMHVLHILLTGKWDPIAMLDDNDLWISSQSFVNATGHAVLAAEALADIIDYDPDLALMPYFFGIYLLQGSFLLLLFADKLQDNITPDVIRACETIVRAHEACISTLDTQYQRNFRRVMRSALQQLRGRVHEDAAEQHNWRREILKLYRWTGDGTGLAL